MTGLPAGIKIEVEFGGGGIWTDITVDVDAGVGVGTKFGRTSEFGDPAPSPFPLTIDNSTSCSTGEGSYTPGRQVIRNGTTAAPYWPNIVPRKRVRWSYTIAGTTYYRFVGYIKSWSPQMFAGGYVPMVLTQAADRLDRLSRVQIERPGYVQTTYVDSPAAMWLLNEPAGARRSVDIFGGMLMSPWQTPRTTPGSYAFAANATPVAAGASEGWVGATTTGTVSMQATIPRNFLTGNDWCLEWWQGIQTGAGTGVSYGLMTADQSSMACITDAKDGGAASAFLEYVDPGHTFQSVAFPSTPDDGLMHHYAIVSDSFSNGILAYVDGVRLGVLTVGLGGTPLNNVPLFLSTVGVTVTAKATLWGPIALYNKTITAARILAHAQIGGAKSMTTGVRVTEYAYWAGLSSGDVNADPGRATVSIHGALGKTVLQLVQDMATTEGGGAVAYINPAGVLRFVDRGYRTSHTTPVLTVDAGGDVDQGTFVPALDDLLLINRVTVTRDTPSAALPSQTAQSGLSQNLYDGVISDSVTTFADNDPDALALAQSRVADRAIPSFRLPQITIDLFTATTPRLYPAISSREIGYRVRVVNLDGAAAPASQLDLIVEGWTETAAIDTYTLTLDTSPADSPARFVWDDATTGYGRWQAVACSLNGAVSNASTTIIIATAAGYPTFTTTAARYPMTILIDGTEQVTLPNAPGGSTSPQTFTGAQRGRNGTPASQHLTSARVELAPAAAWAL